MTNYVDDRCMFSRIDRLRGEFYDMIKIQVQDSTKLTHYTPTTR